MTERKSNHGERVSDFYCSHSFSFFKIKENETTEGQNIFIFSGIYWL
jgi:hypothetical protein